MNQANTSQDRSKPRATSTDMSRWRAAVLASYGASGIAFATWVSRLPAIRDGLNLTPGGIGLLLMCMTVASFISISASGLIVLRLGPKLTTRIGSSMVGAGLVTVGVGTSLMANPLVVAAGLVILGLGTASWNTASNVEGASLERGLERHIMPHLHGAFSLGTVAAAGFGAWAAAIHMPVFWHFLISGVVVTSSVVTATFWFRAEKTAAATQSYRARETDTFQDPSTGPLPIITTDSAGAQADSSKAAAPLDNKRLVALAWRDRRTLLIGVLVLGLALAEGAAGDWVALALADGYGQSDAAGAVGYGLFVTFMTIGRFAGTVILDRFGRVVVMRWCSATAVVGLSLFVFSPVPWLAFVALAVWGLGASLGFPVGMSAAADDPVHAAARVSVVSTIGYGAFLCGPPLLGLLAEHFGILHSLLAPLVLLVVSFFLAPLAGRKTVESAQPNEAR
ncbi:MFS transporter [Paenarthrobacter aurescens]|uniref:MFS transporter n=2 Tax=Paenarthrobacter aurescens TaxID=43663 RepID=A0A4Y3NFN5_PAEAU|nr:MFS transporter [Paenarthrobacter aurescens]MDO6144403.1 MFS transporter [Paenarthrobacter aurescens]MDO6148250.1 MFS transporter [Paenarthrobacter aurescens]MDO6159494.1 MFS transporter [Paenarthrobacter aurescens]GEB17966.1 MFS transporter [Paenarthrobacter aurescens]